MSRPAALLLPLLTALFGSACATMSNATAARAIARDPHSHAEPERVRVKHVALDLTLDFGARRAEGTARLELERRDAAAPLVLDAVALDITAVMGSSGGARRFKVGEADPTRGSRLEIELSPRDTAVIVHYRTTEGAQAMQWLEPEQTAGGKQPFLFTQGQSILTRSWIPLQDSPGVRVTYEATIRAPAGLVAVMSAEQLGRGADGAWRFGMSEPIPPYLIALACGELEFRAISSRTGVWAEPSVVGLAREELDDTERMVQHAEALFGPYRWGRYDLIVLPPSFPFGGMENPRLTFATPTILAGDRSLVGLVAHELAHSWSGNLVTNATWRDFWLNEGFTVYFEQRIMERVFGAERSAMEKVLARRDLELELAELAPWQQVLHCDLAGHHPDDGFSAVPYEKGALFLRRIEQLVGRDEFDRFLRGWFDGHAFESVTTEEFLVSLDRELLARHPEAAAQLDLQAWLYAPGLPSDAPRTQSTLLAAVDREVERWNGQTKASELDTHGWVTQQWLRFLDALPDELHVTQLAELDRTFRFTQSGNSEILCAWLVICAHNRYTAADKATAEFLLRVGRRKFLKPLYAELAKTPGGLRRAKEIYLMARPRYHAVATRTLDELLSWGNVR
ncbi:MAG: M1 family metallopeptidase [Planctomycetes bacterium]|nr:M1 family metallopeptidase [Planctomycetota bacterium]